MFYSQNNFFKLFCYKKNSQSFSVDVKNTFKKEKYKYVKDFPALYKYHKRTCKRIKTNAANYFIKSAKTYWVTHVKKLISKKRQ